MGGGHLFTVLLAFQAISSVFGTSSIVCGDEITIVIPSSEYDTIGIVAATEDEVYLSPTEVEDLTTISPECRPVEQSDSQIQFSGFNVTQCGAVASTDDDYLYYNFTIWRDNREFDDVITRNDVTSIDFQCIYVRGQTLKAPNAISTVIFTDFLNLGYHQGVFTTGLNLYRDSGFSEAFTSGGVVDVDDPVYVEFILSGLDSSSFQYHLQLLKCYAHPTITREESYVMVNDQCVHSNWFDHTGAIEIISSGVGTSARFSFHSFVWNTADTSNQEVYVTCEGRLCDPSTETCTTTCSSKRRRRRSVEQDERPTVVLTTPSITVLPRSRRTTVLGSDFVGENRRIPIR